MIPSTLLTYETQIWRMVVGDDTYLEIRAGGNGRYVFRKQESQKSGCRLIHVDITRAEDLKNETVNTQGTGNWTFYHKRESGRLPDALSDYMVGQNLYDGRTGRKVTDPFMRDKITSTRV